MNTRNLFHPFELACCGYRNSGKTTLIARLCEILAEDFKVGYLKHDAHSFSMDHSGKDTERLTRSGANTVLIYSQEQTARLQKGAPGLLERQEAFENCDLLLIEGLKTGASPKIVVLDEAKSILQAVAAGDITSILAYVGPDHEAPELGFLPAEAQAPYFQRDNLLALCTHIKELWQRILASIPLYGLVLAGGHSTRMQQDKALLQYQERPQLLTARHLLTEFCTQSFISCRAEQWGQQWYQHPYIQEIQAIPPIYDRFLGFGPMGGILSAMMTHPEAAWLVVACDLPLLNTLTLEYLLQHRKPSKLATAFRSNHDGLPEPLCAVYEPRIRSRLLRFLGQGYACPRKVLLNSEIQILNLPHPRALDNANFPADYQELKCQLQGQAAAQFQKKV